MSQKFTAKSERSAIHSVLTQHGLFDEDEAPPLELAPPRRRGGKYDRDPRERCITRRWRRWAVRIAGGKSGKKIYVGMFSNLGEAIMARDRAELGRKQQKKAG